MVRVAVLSWRGSDRLSLCREPLCREPCCRELCCREPCGRRSCLRCGPRCCRGPRLVRYGVAAGADSSRTAASARNRRGGIAPGGAGCGDGCPGADRRLTPRRSIYVAGDLPAIRAGLSGCGVAVHPRSRRSEQSRPADRRCARPAANPRGRTLRFALRQQDLLPESTRQRLQPLGRGDPGAMGREVDGPARWRG